MPIRLKITLVHEDKIKTFDQLAEGESKDEFRARARCAMNIPEGDHYYVFEQEGHKYRGHVSEHCLGMKMVHHTHAPDERLPGLFVLRQVGDRRKVFDYREAPPVAW